MYGQGKTRGQVGITGMEAATNQASAALIAGNKMDPEFLFQCLSNSYEELRGLSNSGGQDNLSAALVGAFRVPVPPLREQHKIALVLRTWDDAIERMQKLVASTREMQRSIIARVLANSPDTRGIPLRRIARPIKSKNLVGETRVLTSSATHGLVSQLDYFNKSISGADLAGYDLLHSGDFAYNRSSSSGFPYGAIRRLQDHPRGVISTLYICFRPSAPDIASSDYLVHLFMSGAMDSQLAIICQEGARNHGLLNIARADFFELTVPVPGMKQQLLVTKALDQAQEEVRLLSIELDFLRTQKRGLMQKLLTGEVRVNVETDQHS